MNQKVIIALLFLLVFAFNQRTFAQMKDSGNYTVYVGSQAVASEDYTSEKLAGGTTKTVSKVATVTYITTTRNDQPVEFAIESNGAKVLTTTFAGGEAKTVTGEQPAKIVKTGATVITENNVWSNFINLLAQYDQKKGGSQNFAAFLPSQSLNLSISMEKTETKDFKSNNQTISLSKYNLVHTQSGLKLTVWADKSNVPYLIEIPAQLAQIVRKGFDDLRGMTAAPKAQMQTFAGEFTSEEVSFPNKDIILAGTLTVPKNDKKSFPAIVIISGSGAQDRDGSTIFNLYRQVAESLSQAGVAVLRVDDRGAGKSVIVNGKPAETSYKDLISDSRAAFEYLMTRKEIDKTKIGLLGHSEGSETALTIASEDRRVAAVVLLSGLSRTTSEGVAEQELYQRAIQETVNASDKNQVTPVAQSFLNKFEAANKPENAGDKKLDWFRQHAASNPSLLAAKVKCPVLIVQGERDLLVLAYHSIELAKALANGGNKNVSLRIIPNQTHLYTPASGDNPQETSKISEEMLRTLQNWAFANLVK